MFQISSFNMRKCFSEINVVLSGWWKRIETQLLRARRVNKSLNAMEIKGSITYDRKDIQDHIKGCYKDLLMDYGESFVDLQLIRSVILHAVMDEENNNLFFIFSEDEVRKGDF